jgi:hypothetical protein
MRSRIGVAATHGVGFPVLLAVSSLVAPASAPAQQQVPSAVRSSRLVVDDHFRLRSAWIQRDSETYNQCDARFADGLAIPMDGDGDQDTNLCEFVRVTPLTSAARIETSVSVLKWSALDPDPEEGSHPGFWIGFGPDAAFSFRISAASAHRPAQVQVFRRTIDNLEPVGDATPIAATFGSAPNALTVELHGHEATLSVNGVRAARFAADTDLAGAVSLGLHANEVDMEVKFGFVRIYEAAETPAPQPVAAVPPPPAPTPAPAAAVAAPSAPRASEDVTGAWKAALPAFLRQLIAQARRGRSLAESFPGVRLGSRRAGNDTIYDVVEGPQLAQASVYLTASEVGRRHRCYTARPNLHTERVPFEAFQAAGGVRGLFPPPWVERQDTPSGTTPLLGVYFTSPAVRGRPAVSVRFVGSRSGGEWYLELQVCRY